MDNRNGDRHNSKWHTQVRDIPPDVWQRVRAAAVARGMTIGDYLTRCVLVSEEARDLIDAGATTQEFWTRMDEKLVELDMEVVRA